MLGQAWLKVLVALESQLAGMKSCVSRSEHGLFASLPHFFHCFFCRIAASKSALCGPSHWLAQNGIDARLQEQASIILTSSSQHIKRERRI